jgi:hypothetical protein
MPRKRQIIAGKAKRSLHRMLSSAADFPVLFLGKGKGPPVQRVGLILWCSLYSGTRGHMRDRHGWMRSRTTYSKVGPHTPKGVSCYQDKRKKF